MKTLTATLEGKYMEKGEYEIYLKGRYHNDSPAFQIVDVPSGQIACIPTVCVNIPPDDNCVWIKNWSENEGIMQSMIEAGLISTPIREIPVGFHTAYECKMLKLSILMEKS